MYPNAAMGGMYDPSAMYPPDGGMGGGMYPPMPDPQSGMYPPGGAGGMMPTDPQSGMYPPGGAGGMMDPQNGGMMAPPSQEMAHYQQLYGLVDTTKQGWIDANVGRDFLSRSGLPLETLQAIWQISDPNGQGYLTPEQFCVAMRLVAHVQAGNNVSPQLVDIDPPRLPEFEGMQRQRGTSEVSGPSVRSDVSMMRPVISNEDVRAPRGRSPPRQFTWNRWAPSEREKRKYASLFLRTDYNGDGYIDGNEAKSLLERANLDNETLRVVWEHADADHDGYLSFPEFVALAHIITCIKRGAALPGLHESLPQELIYHLQNLDAPHNLHAMRSRSTSPARSPSPGELWSNVPSTQMGDPFQTTQQGDPFQTGGPGWDASQQTSPAGGHGFDFNQQTSPAGGHGFDFNQQTSPAGGQGFDFNQQTSPGWDTTADLGQNGGFPSMSSDSRRDKKKKKHHQHDQEFQQPTDSAFDRGFGPSDRNQSPVEQFQPSEASSRYIRRTPRSRREEVDKGPSVAEQIDAARQRFRAIIAADRAVSAQVGKEASEIERELRHTQDACEQWRQQVNQKKQEQAMADEQRGQLEGQLEDVKDDLLELREQRRGMSLDNVVMLRDHDHFQQELEFLQRMMQEEENKLKECYESCEVLKRTYRSLEQQTKELDEQRHKLMQEIVEEEASLRAELRHNANMRTTRDRMWRERTKSHMSKQETYLKEQRFRQMQGQDLSALQAKDLEALALPDDSRHSWASHVSGPSDPRTAWVSEW